MPDRPSSSARRAYYVERPARTVTTFLVYAESAADAVHQVEKGQVEAVDSETLGVGKPRARRAPLEDGRDYA